MFNKKKAHKPFDKLRDVAFFEGFSDDELQRVADLAEDVECEKDAQLIDQGRVGQECFVILSGTASVLANNEHIASLGAGAMVGEMSLIDHRPRNATVVAETDMTLISLDTKAFKDLLASMPKVNDRVMGILSARMR